MGYTWFRMNKQDGDVKKAKLSNSITQLFLRFSRYGWDLAGIFLLAFTLIGLAAFLGLTDGVLVSPVVAELRILFGWGSLLLFIAIGYGGYQALIHRSNRRPFISTGQIISLEIAASSLLVLLSILSGNDVNRAQAGLDYGGLIGWGLAQLLLYLVGSTGQLVVAIGAFVLFLILGSGILKIIGRWIDNKIEEAQASTPVLTFGDREAKAPPVRATKTTENQKAPAAANPERSGLFKILPQVEPTVTEKIVTIKERDSQLPPLTLLTGDHRVRPDERRIKETGELLERSLADFGIPANVTGYRVGPTVTQYAVEPGYLEKTGPDGSTMHQKIRVSQISALSRDLALALSAERLRIEAPVPGRSYVGIEVPNPQSTTVRLRSILESTEFYKLNSSLAVALGRDVSGQPVVADLARMPHLLIAGTTGSGKSVCIAAITTCLIMNNSPATLRLIMIDPKMVELVRFNGIPHLLGKVETELERILAVLKWSLAEMDQRYKLLEQAKAKDLDSYNRKMERRKQATLPKIVLVIDELADLMMSAPDQTEHCLVRLAQLARATGIHLVVATQRPSTDVVTGLIKANFPARISFTVASSIDSRVILDTNGAETLLGRGDMLFLHPEAGSPIRSQGVLITDHELDLITNYWHKQIPEEEQKAAPWEELMNESENGSDDLVQKAITLIKSERRASTSLLQRRLKIGYPRAARLIDELEELGIVGPSQGGGKERNVLIDEDDSNGADDEDEDFS